MAGAREAFDQIASHGGAFVVFLGDPQSVEYLRGKQHNLVYADRQICTELGFLSTLASDCLRLKSARGSEVSLADGMDAGLRDLLNPHVPEAKYRATLIASGRLARTWTPVLLNKYGEVVGGMIRAEDSGPTVLLLPQVSNPAGLIQDLLDRYIPTVCPGLFSSSKEAAWSERDEYEVPKVIAMKGRIEEIRGRAQRDIDALLEEINDVRLEESWQSALLKETGKPLVEAVIAALSALGARRIIDVDAEETSRGRPNGLREDLRIEDGNPIIVVDVKGLAGHPADEDCGQVQKHVLMRMRDLKSTDVHGLAIINHQRGIPPLDRAQSPFRAPIVENASVQHYGLMTAFDLWRLVRGMQANGWTSESLLPVLRRSGHITPTPEHYRLLGRVTHVWKERGAFAVSLESGALHVGESIGVEGALHFHEHKIVSLQLDDRAVNEASAGNVVGIMVSEGHDLLTSGTRVYACT
jgi:hypothetical protein